MTSDVPQVEIFNIDDSLVIVAKGKRRDDFFLNGPRVSEDFTVMREQPNQEKREVS